jgi:hypothetical protein
VYYPDLTPYAYLQERPDENVVNIGWLDAGHEYPRGSVPDAFLARLFDLCASPVNRTRGYHLCPFCAVKKMGLPAALGGRKVTLGSAEIRVPASDGKAYAAPDLIFHYVRDHEYQPPDEFVDAVLSLL